MARDAELRAREFVAISLDNIEVETDASTLESLLGRTEVAVQRFGDPGQRAAARELLARASRRQLESTPPGGDVQLLWTMAFIRSAREPEDVRWVEGLLDATTRPEGLKVDFQVRWEAVNALATIGVAGGDLIASELTRDPTDHGRRQAAAARAARPIASAKQEAWEAVMHDLTPGLAMKRAISGGFHREDQQDLLSAFVQPFFVRLLPLWESLNAEEAILIARLMYPHAVITQQVVDATDVALATDLPPPLHRTLLESQDGTRRALRAQAFDGALPAGAAS
jgi:aminopeptidase N